MRQYVADLKDVNGDSLDSYSFASASGKDAAIERFMADAKKTMEEMGIESATLVMKEDDRGIGSRDLKNAKYALRC